MGTGSIESSTISIEPVTAATDEVRALIEELDGELSRHYPPHQRHGLQLDAIFERRVRFFVARMGGVAAGCGGVAMLDGFAEVKRMYVRPEFRGRGVAEAVLARLEHEALAAGYAILRLETGTMQQAAIRFYRRCGFSHCAAFEPYASMPPHTITTSVFMEKRLAM